MVSIEKIELPVPGMDQLQAETRDEGYDFVGGLNCDPFAASPDIGRIRRVYVRPAWRNRGVGRALVTTLIAEARKHFR